MTWAAVGAALDALRGSVAVLDAAVDQARHAASHRRCATCAYWLRTADPDIRRCAALQGEPETPAGAVCGRWLARSG